MLAKREGGSGDENGNNPFLNTSRIRTAIANKRPVDQELIKPECHYSKHSCLRDFWSHFGTLFSLLNLQLDTRAIEVDSYNDTTNLERD